MYRHVRNLVNFICMVVVSDPQDKGL